MRPSFRSVAVIGMAGAMLVAAPRAGLAWGQQAHRVVATLADRVLQQSDAAARAKVLALLATDKENRLTKNDIASEATWADVLREKSPEARVATSGWHAVRLKPDSPDIAAACFGHKPLPAGYPASRGPQENCAIDKIEQFQKELANSETSSYEKVSAVQFLLNLVADVNDPLLTIDRGDQEGQCIALQIGTKPPVRLSSFWEETLVAEALGADAAKGAARLAAAVAPGDMQKWATGDPTAWAREAHEVAKTVVYSFAAEQPTGKHSFPGKAGQPDPCGPVPLYRVGPEYETKALAALRDQLAKAGVRLALVLRNSVK